MVYPVSQLVLCERLLNIPQQEVTVSYYWHRNHSTVLSASYWLGRERFGSEWELDVYAVEHGKLDLVRQFLYEEGLPQLSDWFIKSKKLINRDDRAFFGIKITGDRLSCSS